MKDNLKRTMPKFLMMFVLILFGSILAGSRSVRAAEKPQMTKEEYQTQYDDAVRLADMLKQSPYLLHNKLYTAEQETKLQTLVDSVCSGKETDREKADALLSCIADRLEPGDCYELNGWDTLCDGENEQISASGKPVAKKNAVNETVYCFTFYDVCRLAGIPCFILADDHGSASGERHIAMVYVEHPTDSGMDWYFVDVASENIQFVSREDAYEILGEGIYPTALMLDYAKALYSVNLIYLNRSSVSKMTAVPDLAYDRDTDTVKVYFTLGELAKGEQYLRTEAYVGEDGTAPSGWIWTKSYSDEKATAHLCYAVCGVFLRGRVEKDGTEYNLQTEYNSYIPYHETIESGAESEEHKAFVTGYRKRLEQKAIQYAEALLKDENYIWDDTDFTAEEEALLLDALDTALNWDYINGDERSLLAFEMAGIPLSEEDPANLSEKAKAQAILMYVKRNVAYGGSEWSGNSADVLKQKAAACAGQTLLYRDLCVMAGLPCFQLKCATGISLGDCLFGDHGDNLVKAGEEWFFCDPTNASVLGKGGCIQLAFMEGYDISEETNIYLDCESLRRDNYGKWQGIYLKADYYDFDDAGNLGIYRRDRFGNPVVESGTDENGRYVMKNGLQTVDAAAMNEDRSAEITTRYAYYYQNLRELKGKKRIDGTEYTFDTGITGHPYCQIMQEVSRRYVISKLTFQPLEDQPYQEGGACPVPEIYHGDKKLEPGKDFIITEYRNNKALTTYTDASYTVEGIGGYMGQATRYFKVVQADISTWDVKLSQTSFTWRPDTKSYKPDVEWDLTAPNYSVAYYDNQKVGTARAVITGKGNCKGSVTLEYEIKPGVWNEEEYQILGRNMQPLQSQKFAYNLSPIAADAEVCWYNEKGNAYYLSGISDYELSYIGTEHPGIVIVTATAKGNYQGTLTCTYEITPYVLREEAIKAEYTRTVYNGNVQKPAVTIEGLIEGKDYFVSYEKRVDGGYQETEPKEAGEYRIIVRVSEDFTIQKEGTSEDKSNICEITYVILADTAGGGTGSSETETGSSETETGSSGTETASSETVTYTVTFNSKGGSAVAAVTVTSGGKVTAPKNPARKKYTFSGWYNGKKKYDFNKAVTANLTLTAKWKAVTVDQPQISGLKNKKSKQITVSVKKAAGAAGYRVTYSTSKQFQKGKNTKTVTSGKNTITIPKLKKGKTYYVKVQAYKKDSANQKIYSKYSKVKKIKVKK